MNIRTIALPLLLCMSTPAPLCAGDQTDPAAALLQADREFARLSAESGPKTAFAAYIAPNVLMLTRSGEPVEGFENAIASFGDEPGYDLLWQPRLAEVAASGEMGWTWGTYQVIVDGNEVSQGKYVNIWTLQSGGQWKVRMDMGNQEPAREPSDENP